MRIIIQNFGILGILNKVKSNSYLALSYETVSYSQAKFEYRETW